jgi:tetratricopeptide (TPR) repeat protein
MKRLCLPAVIALVVLGCSRSSSPPHGRTPDAAAAPTHRQAATSAAPRRVALMPGFGDVHHAIRTRNPEAQRFFDQGLALVYGFNHEEAIRSFRRAAELDPQAAMPLWGIALALGPNINMDVDAAAETSAFDALQKAVAAAPGAPDNERAYVAALARRYADDSKADLKQLAGDYAAAMRDLSKRYPDDLDAATLYAEALMDLRPWKLWKPDGTPEPGTEEIVRVLESVLTRDPRHLGANHYYIHAVEASAHPERALPSARAFATLAPASGHLVHMPAHTFMRVGDYQGASEANLRAIKADEAYFAASAAQGTYTMYYAHNFQFLSASRAMEGRFADAKRAADEVETLLQPMLKEMPMLQGFQPIATMVLVRFERWGDVLQVPEPDRAWPIATAMWHFARGSASAAMARVRQAVEEREAFQAARGRVPAAAPFTPLTTAASVLEVAALTLDARIAAASGDPGQALTAWRKAVDAEDRIAYDEPPAWPCPSREALGAALLKAGRLGEAETVFREDLRRNPNNGRSLFGSWKALEMAREGRAADQAHAAFAQAWKNADVQLRIQDLR